MINLTDADFDGVDLKDKSISSIVLFYADWCGACKNFKPILDKVASDHIASGWKLYKVDCTSANQELSKQCNIAAFPTILKFANGKNVGEYNGDRSEQSVISTIQSLKKTHKKVRFEDDVNNSQSIQKKCSAKINWWYVILLLLCVSIIGFLAYKTF